MKSPTTSLEETKALMLGNMPSPEKPWNQRWAILLRPEPKIEDEKVSSSKSSREMDEKPRMIGVIGVVREQELGYKLNPEFWGKGYMTEALGMMSKLFWEMEGMNLHLIFLLQ